MAVTVSPYNASAQLLLSQGSVSYANLYVELLSSSASFTATHTSKDQVDNGAHATATMTIATPGVSTWAGNTLSNGDKVAFLTTGALPTGLTAGVWYYVVNNGTDGSGKFRVSATSGGSAINTSGSQSGTHTVYSIGSYEVSGNAWPVGGSHIANVADTTVTTNDAMIDADDTVVNATGGSIGPASAAVVYDLTTMKPLFYIDFGGALTAGVSTDFRFTWNASGLITGTVA